MKVILVWSAAFAVVALAAPPSEETKAKFAAIHKKCQAEVPVDDDIYGKLRNHEDVELPENWGAHQLCMSKGAELMDANGKINKEKVREALERLHVPADKLEEIHAKCVEEMETPEKTAVHLGKCFMKTAQHGVDHLSHHH